MGGWLIEASFVGWAVGFAVALPFYVRSRWPSAVTCAGRPGWVPVALAVALSAVSLYWTLGGTAGIAHPGLRDLDWRLMTGNTAIWAGAAAWAGWALGRAGRGRLPVAVTWVASGYLFAWSAWKLPFTLFLAGSTPVWPEQLGVAAVQYALSVLTGLLLLGPVTGRYGRGRAATPPSRPAAPRP